MTLSVLVVGPALVREGLRALLTQEEDFSVMPGAAEALWDRPPPDVIVCCAEAPDEVRDLRTRWPQADVLVVADLAPAAARALHDLGAIGLFPLTAEPDELIWAIRSVAQGKLTLHPIVLRALIAHLAEAEAPLPSPPPVQLTARELEVLHHLTVGASDKDIAQQLYLSVRTVQSHLARLYHKLGVHSRTEAALAAIRAGWFAENPTVQRPRSQDGTDEFSNSTEGETRHPALVLARHQ